MSRSWNLEVYFDGDCPICVREIDFLEWLDADNRVRFVDIAKPDFDEAHGKSYERLMGRIHARTADGDWLEGVEVFEKLYSEVGLGVVSAIIQIPGIHWLVRKSYDWFARNRLQLTGRCDSENCKVHQK